MAELKSYDVNGRQVLLSDEDAQARGLSGGSTYDAASTPPLNTDGSPEQDAARNPAAPTPGLPDQEVAAEPATKARASSNK